MREFISANIHMSPLVYAALIKRARKENKAMSEIVKQAVIKYLDLDLGGTVPARKENK